MHDDDGGDGGHVHHHAYVDILPTFVLAHKNFLLKKFYCSPGKPSVEYDGFFAVDKNTVLGVKTKGLGKHKTFQVPPFADKIVKRILVADPHDILLDNRSLIKLFGNVMTCCTDDFDSPFISLPIGTAANKRWQKRVMDIDDPARIALDKLRVRAPAYNGQAQPYRSSVAQEGLFPAAQFPP